MSKTQIIQPVNLHFIRYSLIFGACYWAMDAVRDVITFNRGSFLERFFRPDFSSTWMRILVVCIILLFGCVSDLIHEKRKSKYWRSLLQSDWGLFFMACIFSLLFWFFEAFRDSYVYGSGSYLEMVFTPSSAIFWMRMMVIFFLILFGLFVQTGVNELLHEEKILKKEQLKLEELLQSKSLELNEAKTLIYRMQKEIQRRLWLENENSKIRNQLIHAQKVEAIGVVAGGLAHDFNNLMTAILGVSTLALKEIPSETSLYNDLHQIKTAAGRAADLTRQLLLFSREQPMKFTALNLNSAIQGLKKMLQSLIGEDILLAFELDESLSSIYGDKGSIEQVIINLVVNSRDALTRSGHITVQTKNVNHHGKDDRIHIRNKSNQYVCLTVKDNGTGISPDIRDKIFEPFFSTKSPGNGTGLGLSVVNQIINKHHGWIDVESEPDRGAVFSVFLPVIISRVVKHDDQCADFINHRGTGKRILVVEDDENVRNFTYRALSQQGYTVLTAQCANEARTLFYGERGSFDLIFSDVVLPDESGVDLVLALRADYPHIPVLLCSGHADSKSQWPRIKEHGFPFLKKPFELNELLRGVQEII